MKSKRANQRFSRFFVNEKKAAMSSRMVAGVILVLAAMILIGAVYSVIDWEGISDEEVCKQSIILRSTFSYGGLEAGKEAIPLKCTTQKICIVNDEEEKCVGMADTKNSEVFKIELKDEKDKAAKEQKILEVFSQEIRDCHETLGEGKLNFMPHKASRKRYCLLCSRIAMSPSVRDEIKEIDYFEVLGKMEKMESGGKSYLEFVYGAQSKDQIKEVFQDRIDALNEQVVTSKMKIESIKDFKFDLIADEKGYTISSVIVAEGHWLYEAAAVVAIPTALVIIGIVNAPVTLGASLTLTAIGVTMALGTATTTAIYFAKFPDGSGEYALPFIFPYDVRYLKTLDCNSFETAP